MTDTPAPDAAVQIAAEALSNFTDNDWQLARVVCGVLARADRLCPPRTADRHYVLDFVHISPAERGVMMWHWLRSRCGCHCLLCFHGHHGVCGRCAG